jgi:AcrR family transcriptional regulator
MGSEATTRPASSGPSSGELGVGAQAAAVVGERGSGELGVGGERGVGGGTNGAQTERRQRILDAAVALASSGGYDAVQMREVAANADVALGTLYRYFPSKEHLLVSVLHGRVQAMAAAFGAHGRRSGDGREGRGADPHDRVVDLLRWATRALQTEPLLTAATLRAFVSPEPSLAEIVRATGDATTAVIVEAMHPGPASATDRAVARYLQYLWMSFLASWINGVSGAAEMLDELEDAARMILAGAAARPDR